MVIVNSADNLPLPPPIFGEDEDSRSMPRISVLYIDQTPILLDIACRYLERKGEITVDTSIAAEQAIRKMRYISYDVIVTDYNNADIGGNNLLRYVRSLGDSIPFVYFVHFRVPDLEAEAEEFGGVSVVDKMNHSERSSFHDLSDAIKEAFWSSRGRSLAAPSDGAVPVPAVKPS